MIQRKFLLGALALTSLTAFAAIADARPVRIGGGGYGRGYGGYGGGYGGYGRGYGSGLSITLGRGGYGYGGYGGYGSGYRGGYYAPSAGYSNYGGYAYSAPPAVYADPGYPPLDPPSAERRSGYYAPEPAGNTAHVRVLVPANARVWVDGQPMSSVGAERQFVTPELNPGKSFTYQIKARWMEGGRPVEQVRTARVQANRSTTVDFTSGVPEVPEEER